MRSKTTIGDLVDAGFADLQTGPFGTQLKAAEYVPSGIPVINVRNIGLGNIRNEKLEHVGVDTAERLRQHRLRSGDIVFGRKGAVERHAFLRDDHEGWMQGSDCIRLRLDGGPLVPRFVSYYLATPTHQRWMINQCSHGATMASLNQDILRRIEVPTPPIDVQCVVAAVLGAYDDLIENNLRRIELLDEMAQAVYREWFVNLRFPGHEETTLAQSPVGEIPSAWKAAQLGDHVELAYGKALKADARTGGHIPVYGSSGVVGWHDEYLVPGPGIVVGRKGNVGSVYWTDGDFFPIDTTFYVRSQLPLSYLYHNLKSQQFLNSDAAVPGLNRNQAYANPLIVPPDSVLGMFDGIVRPMVDIRRNLERQNDNLREARDLLLPRLVSGEIDVSDLDVDTEWLAS